MIGKRKILFILILSLCFFPKSVFASEKELCSTSDTNKCEWLYGINVNRTVADTSGNSINEEYITSNYPTNSFINPSQSILLPGILSESYTSYLKTINFSISPDLYTNSGGKNFEKFKKNGKYEVIYSFSSSPLIDIFVPNMDPFINIYHLNDGIDDVFFSEYESEGVDYFQELNLIFSEYTDGEYKIVIQFIPKRNLNSITFTMGRPLNAEPFFHKSLNDLNIKYESFSISEVDDFSFSSGVIHGGGGISLDKIQDDDIPLIEYEVCENTDILCHLRNMMTGIKNLFIRLGNGFRGLIQGLRNVIGWLGDIVRAIGNIVSDFISALWNFFVDVISYMFVLPDDYLSTKLNVTQTLAENKLGILYFPFSFFGDVMGRFININSSQTTIINIPELTVPGVGILLKARSFNLTEYWSTEPFRTMYTVYLSFVYFLVVFALYKLCMKKYNEFIEGGAD